MAAVLEPPDTARKNKNLDPSLFDDDCITEASIYKTEYIDHGLHKRQPIFPRQRAVVCGPMQDQTSYMMDYVPHELPDKFQRDKAKYRPPEESMNDRSSYQTDYLANPGEAAQSFRPNLRWKSPDVAMEDASTYKGDFGRISKIDMLRSRQPLAFLSNNIRNSEATFANESTYKADYPGYRGSRPGQILPHPSWRIGDGPMNTQSTYKDDFKGYNQEPAQSLKPLLGYSAPRIRFAGESTTTSDFVHPGNPKRRDALRPRRNCLMGSGPFATLTTFTTDYVPHYVDKPGAPPWSIRKPLEKSDVPMEGRSIYRSSFMPHEQKGRPTQFHPGYGNVFFGDECRGLLSEYTENYRKPWTPDRTDMIKHKGQWIPPSGPFRSETTFTESYKGRRGEAAEPIKPFGNPWWGDRRGSVPNTTYRGDYLDPVYGAKATAKTPTAGHRNSYHLNALKRLMKPDCPPLPQSQVVS